MTAEQLANAPNSVRTTALFPGAAAMTEQLSADVPTVATRIILWPTHDGHIVDTADTSLADANAIELAEFARDYAGVPLLELMRRLRVAEWNADYYRQEAEQAQKASRRLPALSTIREMDARHRKVRALLDAPGKRAIPKADLRAALSEPA